MKIRTVFLSFARLATGEVLGRIATFTLFAYVSRCFGVQVFGIIALGQTVASYVMVGSDQGLKLIGARLRPRSRWAHSMRSSVRSHLRQLPACWPSISP